MAETNDGRPDPEALLQQVKAAEARAARAKLKVFFGYAPGVGKTYTMLESARRLAAGGATVMVGCVETHGRPETAALLEGLPVLPRREVLYRGTTLAELDLELALVRRPQILLVDELAHTNAPGGRHAKRWQDVLELLDAGVEVHTTLNVQHVESLNDVIEQITFVRVRETVPDAILERADEVELVDLTPDELLARLREGKVYVPEQAGRALQHFFRQGNLLALRELALRRTAERVDADVLAYRREHDIQATWPSAERILACVGPSPSAAALVRSARRMAVGLRARWVAAYVDAPGPYARSPEDEERLQANLRLAESLGAEVVRLSGGRVGEELLRYARRHNVTRIVVGKPRHPRWRDLFAGSLVDDLVRGSGDIEVHFVAGEGDAGRPERAAPRRLPAPSALRPYGTALLLVAAATALAVLADRYLAAPDTVMLYLLAIVVAALRLERGPTWAASLLSVAAYDLLFVPPFYTFRVGDTRHLLTFCMLLAVGGIVCDLALRLRRQEADARDREAHTAALYALTRDLMATSDRDGVARVAARHAADVFEGAAAVLFRGLDGSLAVAGAQPPGHELGAEQLAVARWAAERGRPAGVGTDTLPGAGVTCLPLGSGAETAGVLALSDSSLAMLEVEGRTFGDAFARQVALAIDRARLRAESEASALRAKTEEMRTSLLSSVSHDLRTPLAALTGAGTTLRDDGARLNAGQRAELLDTVCTEAERMERLVTNLLDMVRLQSGALTVRREWVPLEEVVGSALARLDARLEGREVAADLAEDLPLLSLDPVLFEQVIVNLLDNALKYTPPGTPLDVSARRGPSVVEVDVADRGPGLPAGAEERIFEKFVRGEHPGVGGAGLGLPICRGIVGAHGGALVAENRAGGGALFRIRLPLLEPPVVKEPTT